MLSALVHALGNLPPARRGREVRIVVPRTEAPLVTHQVDPDRHREPWRRKNRRGR